MRRKVFQIVSFLVVSFAVTALLACHEDDAPDANGSADTSPQDSTELFTYNSEVRYTQPTVVMGVVDKDVTAAVNYYLTNQQTAVDDNTRLLIVSDTNTVSRQEMEQVYANGGTIAVLYPTKAKLDAFFAETGWNGHNSDDDINTAILYSFNKRGDVFIMTGLDNEDIMLDPSDPEDLAILKQDAFFNYKDSAQADSAEEGEAESVALTREEILERYLFSSFEFFFNELNENDEGGALSARRLRRLADEESDKININDIVSATNLTKTYSFTRNEKYKYSFTLNCTGCYMLSLSYYTLHAYGKGDYYFCSADVSFANGGMYLGKGSRRHIGTWVRWCGAICTDCKYELAPVDNGVAVVGSVQPETTQGVTTYTTSNSFSLQTSATVGGGVSDLGKDKPTGSVNASAKLGMNWGWTESKSRPIADTDVLQYSSGNSISHGMTFNNLPYFHWKSSYGYEEGNSRAFRSTMCIHSSWVWYDTTSPRTNDDSGDVGLKFKLNLLGNYEIFHFETTKLDNKPHKFSVPQQDIITLDALNRDRAGNVVIDNNSDKQISNIQVFNGDTQIYQDANFYTPGTKVSLGGLKLKYSDSYKVTLTIGGKSYSYQNAATNNIVPLTNGQTTTLLVKGNFLSE